MLRFAKKVLQAGTQESQRQRFYTAAPTFFTFSYLAMTHQDESKLPKDNPNKVVVDSCELSNACSVVATEVVDKPKGPSPSASC